MQRVFVILTILAGGVLACIGAHASYLEEPKELGPPSRIVPPPPRPHPDNPLTDALRGITVQSGYTHKGLTVFPLTHAKTMDSTNYLSLSEALREDLLVVTEKGGGSVPALLAENRGGRFILMLAGDVLTGGKQNRTLQQDVLLPPKSGKVELPVLCVERGRWSGRGTAFERNPSVAALNVRAVAQAGESQDAVWSTVGDYQRKLNISSGTGDLQAVNESAEVRRVLADYTSAFTKRWPRQAVGMVVARHGQIAGADVFCNPRVFRKQRDRLLESYALDCHAMRRLDEGAMRERIAPPPVSRRDAERFLRRVLRAEHTWTSTPGAGRLLRVRGAGIDGMALVRADAVLHAGLFAQHVVRPLPLPDPGPPPMPLPGLQE